MKKTRDSPHSVFSIQYSVPHGHLPHHVAIIMDGNRRWARARGLAAIKGHDKAARDVIEPIVDHAIELGIKFLTFWAFSTENWKRDNREITALMGIFREGMDKLGTKLHEKGVRLNIIGEMSKFPKDIQTKSSKYIELSKGNKKITVSFALNYGGRDEILRAIQRLISAIQNSTFSIQNLNEESFSSFLDTAGMPDPDLIIRTGGDLRLSGYFPWQSVYSELYFTPILWPDFTPREFDKALSEYNKRQRRFGGK